MPRRLMGRLILTLLVAAPLLVIATSQLVTPLSAQIPEGMEGAPFVPHPEAEEAIGRLYSPFCPGLMLGVCPSPNATALRDSLQERAFGGETADELVEWTLSRYGREYLALPPGTGWGLWAWILPPLGLLGGGALIVRFLRRGSELRLAEAGAAGGAVKGAGDGAPDRVISEEEDARLRAAITEIELSEDPSF